MNLKQMRRVMTIVLAVVCILFMPVGLERLKGCPFCAALSKPLREELASLDHVAIAVCELPAAEGIDLPIHRLRIERDLIGNVARKGEVVYVYSKSKHQAGDKVLLFGIGSGTKIEWAPSKSLGQAALDYIDRVVRLHVSDKERIKLDNDSNDKELTIVEADDVLEPAEDQSRANEVVWLNLSWTNLESDDSWVRRDCFNAVAQASVSDMRAWTKQLDIAEVLRRLESPKTSIDHRRFYWTVLSLCGRSEDAEFARTQIFSYLNPANDRLDADPIGLDAAISCFVLLGGEEALEEVDKRILLDPKRLYSDRYAAIVALRVHAVEFKQIEAKRLAESLSLALSEPAIADLVIPDLARMEDWTHVTRLLELYRGAGQVQQYLRVPIINYLRACPLPEAQQALEECRVLDPDAFRRAATIFPVLPTPDPQG